MSGGGGTTQTSSQQNTNFDQGPWSQQQPFLTAGWNNATNLNNNNPINSPMNPGQTQALSQIQQQGLQPNQTVGAAGSFLNDQLAGKYLSPNSNPYLSGMFNTAADAVTRQYQSATSPETASLFAQANRTGSGAAANATTQNQLNLGSTLNGLANNFYGGAYNQGVQNMFSASGQAPGINQAGFFNPSQALGAGNQQQQLQLQTQMQPWQQAGLYQGLIGSPTGSSGYSNMQGTQQTPYYSNTAGQILGGATSLIGAAAPFASLAFSDVRLKEDISPVGKTYDGQNLYAYRYKGDPTPHVGLMAQEVEQRDPGAVLTHPSGFKMVDYKRALGWRAFDA